jgi:hypothetical protein
VDRQSFRRFRVYRRSGRVRLALARVGARVVKRLGGTELDDAIAMAGTDERGDDVVKADRGYRPSSAATKP